VTVQAWDHGARPGHDCTAALAAAVAAAGPGGRIELPPNPGDYYVQPHAPGYLAVGLLAGQTLAGAPGVVLASLPGGRAGQLVGVRNTSGAPVGGVRLEGLTVRNDEPYDGQKAAAIVFSGTVPGALVEDVEVVDCVVLGAKGGDGIHFGNLTRRMTVRGGSVDGYARHGICVAGGGPDREGFLLEGVRVGPAERAWKAVQTEPTRPGVRGVVVRDSRLEDTVNANLAPGATIERCSVIGAVQLVNAPGSRVVGCAIEFRRRPGSSERAVLLREDCAGTEIRGCLVINRMPADRDAKPAVTLSHSARVVVADNVVLTPIGTAGVQWPLDGTGVDGGGNVVIEVDPIRP
jgi:hypothetical protein